MDNEIKRLIEKYINLIDNNEWEDFFFTLAYEEEISELQCMDIIHCLNQVGIDTSLVREEIFMSAFVDWYTDADDWTAPEDIVAHASTCGSFGVPYERRCKLIIDWAEAHPGTIDWVWDTQDHSDFQVLCLEN